MGRKKGFGWRWRLLALLLLLAAIVAIYAWWRAQHWMPSRDDYPAQGALIGAADGVVDFKALKAIGASFVYLEASSGAKGRDARLGENLRAIANSGLPYGALHAYDPCVPAELQAGNFVTVVPRDAKLLPPVIAFDKLASDCGDPIAEAGLESELTVFLNQVESHAGQPAVLKVSPAFEERHPIAARIERNLWLSGSYVEPDYAGRPFALWTANDHLRTEAAEAGLRWVVVQP